jgi:hypothetical protein
MAMFDLINQCKAIIVSDENLIVNFDCGDYDLNDFFNHEALLFGEQL